MKAGVRLGALSAIEMAAEDYVERILTVGLASAEIIL
jgi:hypothetical protein